METIEQFYDRISVNFVTNTVFVYKSKSDMFNEDIKGDKWTIEQAKQYLNWLRNNQQDKTFNDAVKRGKLI